MKPEELPSVLRVEDVARILDISRSSAYEAIKNGQVPAIRVGRRLRVPRIALERLLRAEGGQNALGGAAEPQVSDLRSGR